MIVVGVRRDHGFPHNLVFVFQVENGLRANNENIEYLEHYVTDFLQYLSMCSGK